MSNLVFMLLLSGLTVNAHILLSDPLPRGVNSDNLKQNANRPDPCGNRPRGNNPRIYEPGQVVNFSFRETIEHPGRFRVQFSPANDVGFELPENQLALLEDVNRADTQFTMQAKMPMQECDQCTIRVIQEMDDQPGELYVNCIDINIKAAAAPPAPTPTDPTLPPPTETPVTNDNSGQSVVEANDIEARQKPKMASGCGFIGNNHQKPQGPNQSGMGLILFFLLFPLTLVKVMGSYRPTH